MRHRTVVVGGGIAGMACAFKLLQENQDFLLITDALGGRIRYDARQGINFGAYFFMANYTHAKKLLLKGQVINPLDVCFHNSATERFALLNPHTLKRLPELLRFYSAMREFSRHYEAYKTRCLEMPQIAALGADPYMADLFVKPAAKFIKEKRFEKVAEDYISKFTYACTGAGPDQITALDFLNVSMGIILPIHQFKFDQAAISQQLGDHLVLDTITSIEPQNGAYRLTGHTGACYEAPNVIVATPAVITKELLHLKEIREACKLYVFHVKATLKPLYTRYTLNLFSYSSPIMLTARQHDGTYLIYSREKEVDLARVCEHFELIGFVPWDKAMYVYGRAFMPQQTSEGIYIAGDHNGLGLEPAAISGIFAANQVIQQNQPEEVTR